MIDLFLKFMIIMHFKADRQQKFTEWHEYDRSTNLKPNHQFLYLPKEFDCWVSVSNRNSEY